MDWQNQQIQKTSSFYSQLWYASAVLPQQPITKTSLDKALNEADSVFKHDRTTTVAKVNEQDSPFMLKRYNARNHWHKIKRAFRRSRARRCWNMSYHFQKAGLNVAQPLIMYERRFGLVRADTYFASEFLPGTELLELLPEMSSNERNKVVLAITNAFNKMRSNKLSHGDMKASNLLWVEGEMYFVDLDAAKKHYTDIGWRAANRKDIKRFLKNWQDSADLLELFKELNAVSNRSIIP